jgi:hypothetical protein
MKLFNGVEKEIVKHFTDHMKEIQKIHFETTDPMDAYFTGMYNGMEVLIASIEGREGEFKTASQGAFGEVLSKDIPMKSEGKN